MKYFIYWCCYLSTLGGGDIAGVIEVTDTTVTSYIYGEGYLTWDIIDKEIGMSDDGRRIDYATFYLRAANVGSVLKFNGKNIEQHIQTDPPVHITMRRKKI